MPSPESLKVLKALNVPYPIPEDRLPKNVNLSLIPFLLERELVKKISLVPPGREDEYPYGLWAYIIDSAGLEVLQEADEELQKEAKQDAKDKRRYFFERVEFWLGILIGWFLGGFTPETVFSWIKELFH